MSLHLSRQIFRVLSVYFNIIKHKRIINNTNGSTNIMIKNILYSKPFLTTLCSMFWNSKEPKIKFADSSRAKDNFIVKVTRQCSDSVVYIEIKNPKRLAPDSGKPITQSNGSGFIIREDGWILTNAHVIMNKPNTVVMVTLNDGKQYMADIKEIDLRTDLALLKIHAKNLSALKFGNSSECCVGEWVVALGSPLSLSHTITAGVISSINRDAQELGICHQSLKYIQTDAAITFGHSGGPLVNLDGEVIGINNLRITAGIAFAIPINYAKDFVANSVLNNPKKLMSEEVVRDRLGMALLTLNSSMIRQLMFEKKITVPTSIENGALVWKVVHGLPAAKCGLLSGDIITHVNGCQIFQCSDVYSLLAKNERKKVNLVVYREGQKKDVTLTIN